MLKAERQAKILQIVRKNGFAETEELARILGVSQVTIRRDLRALSAQDLVRLDHGGSASIDYLGEFTEPLYETKVYLNHDQKEAIGVAAAALIKSGDTVILDSGTTNAEIARQLYRSGLGNITVITCDVMIAKKLCPVSTINVLVLGGILRHSYYSAYGPYTEDVLHNVKANKFFLGIDAASVGHGVSNIVLEEIPIKKLCIEVSQATILVADSTKFGRDAPYRLCGWEQIDQVITDDGIAEDTRRFWEENKIPFQAVRAVGEPASDDRGVRRVEPT